MLQNFLEANLVKGKKATKSPLGVIEPTLATAIQENLSIPCRSDDTIREIIRGTRFHFTNFVKALQGKAMRCTALISCKLISMMNFLGGLLEQSQLGLGHSYSRSKVILLFMTPKRHIYSPARILILVTTND